MENKSNSNSTPWENGYYRSKGMASMLFFVDGEECTMEGLSGKPTKVDPMSKGTWKYGNFGEDRPDIVKQTGKMYTIH